MNCRIIWNATFIAMLLLSQTEWSSSANILALFPLSSRSHSNMFSTIAKALVEKGHHITMVTSIPLNTTSPNYKEIDTSKDLMHLLNTFNPKEKTGVLELIMKMKYISNDICKKTLKKPEIIKLMNPSNLAERFDLMFLSNFFAECFYPFAHIHEMPIVLISPAGPTTTPQRMIGNIALPSFIANPLLPYSDRMTFPQRVINTLLTGGFILYYKFYILRNVELVMKEAFGESVPTIYELEKHVSLVLLNNHFSLNGARPLVPNMIEVGGLHVKPPKELPKELKKFMDSASKDGVIYFSLGSIIKSENIPTETRDALVGAFSQLKQKVLWKWEGDQPIPGQSKNIMLEKWLPQQDVLAHPNVKLFITHGGLFSFQEAVSRGVPLIGIPYFGDQDGNINKVIELQVGVKLDTKNLTKENILNAINKVLGDSTYSTNMKKIQSVVTDQINEPLERALYWIEYVLRYKGAKHLLTASVDLAWYELYMLDIFFVIIILPLIVFSVMTYIVIKLLKRKCCSNKISADKSKKDK